MNIIIIIIITVAITAIEWRSGDNDVTNDLVLHRILEHKLRASGCNLTMLGVVGQQCCVRLHGAKSFIGFKHCATTTPKNMQQGVQTDATCNIPQCCVSLHGVLFAFSLEMLYFLATYTSGTCLS